MTPTSTAPVVASPPVLSLAERIYYYLSERRRRRWSGREDLPALENCSLISVGNITTGGTGKTPAVQWLARKLNQPPCKIAIVARGYGGSASPSGAVVSDGTAIILNAAQSGDEPLLHARSLPGVPVLIGRDRNAVVRQAVESFGANLIVLDDAFQYWSLPRDFDLVLMDARRPFDNGHLLPKGHLRELPAALQRADAILLTRCDRATPDERTRSRRQIAAWTTVPIFESIHEPVALRDEASGATLPLETLQKSKIVALSALADNEAFVSTLMALDASIVATVGRRDHHHWRQAEVSRTAQQARAQGAVAVVTTEKDAVKLQATWTAPLPLWSLVIRLNVEGEEELLSQIRGCLARSRRRVAKIDERADRA